MTLNVDNHTDNADGKPRHWSTNSQMPLARARRRRTLAQKRVTKAQAEVDLFQAQFDAAASEVADIEALVAKGVRGLN